MSRRKNLKAFLAGGACALALASGGMAAAQTRDYDVPAGDLMAALDAYARQSGVQLIYKIADVSGVKSGGAQGALSDDEALNRLLEGTNFQVSRDPSGAIAIALEGRRGPQFASAAAEDAEGTVEALIVTAQKREEDIQDVPIAISAFTQEQLERSQVAGGPDLITQVPNMTFTKTNFTSYSIQLRGIGTQAISATTDAAVAVALNNTPFIRNRFFEQEFFDLQRVEVLRGPQGTLYGRNATAGVVNLISQKPKLGIFEAKLSGDIANFSSTRVEGMINLPLAEDYAALRLAGAWTRREGYATNQLTGNPIDGRDLWSTRVSLAIQPTDRFRADLIWEHFEEDDDRLRSGKQLCKRDDAPSINGVPMPEGGGIVGDTHPLRVYNQGCIAASLYGDESFQTPSGNSLPYYAPLLRLGLPAFYDFDPYVSNTQSRDLRVIESTIDPEYRAKTDLAELQVSFDLTEDLTLTSETAYADDFVWSMQDFNRFTTRPGAFQENYGRDFGTGHFHNRPGLLVNGVYCDPQLGCSDRVLAADLATAQSQHFSQELRLGSDFEGPFNFSLGANYLRYDTEDKYYVFINTLTLLAAVNVNGVTGTPQNLPVWMSEISDNRGCLPFGEIETNFNHVYSVSTCKYLEMNSIENIQDKGHNYFLSKNPYKLISYAVFGEAYFNVTDDLKLTAGLRWTVDKKEAPRHPSQLFIPHSVGYPVQEVIEQEWREPTGRLTIDWKPDLSFTDETLLYASYAHGYKAGGANPPTATPLTFCVSCSGVLDPDKLLAESLTHPRTFDPEFIDAYEVGAKNTLLEGRLTLNTAAFYYDYEAYQISEIVERAAFNHNYDAKVWGLELEADWRPLENLRLGFKGGYEDTEIAEGEYAIDLMDRTAGDPDWVVARPFPTVPSNCILPSYIATTGVSGVVQTGGQTGGIPGMCESAYVHGVDPVTGLPYVPNPTVGASGFPGPALWVDYPGFDPETAPNGGEGIAKHLGGNELPNAPHFTATLTADYTIPLPNDWLATLHTDLYYQSEAWTRIFNTEGYDKLKAYTNVNLAAIFTNEDAGWKVMAYVKNVFDKDNITGAFLNSDDTGLTTNVFLTEPRLYGLRVTKEWTGGSPVFGFGNAGPAPFWVELTGDVERHDAPYEEIRPAFFDSFSDVIDPGKAQNRDLDWGQGGSVRATYQAVNSPWQVSGGIRWGKTGTSHRVEAREREALSCLLLDVVYNGVELCDPESQKYWSGGVFLGHYPTNYSNVSIGAREEHQLIDFKVGREVGLGGLKTSRVEAGIAHGRLESRMDMRAQGIPDWRVPLTMALFTPSQHERYDSHFDADRTFEGTGPIISWEASSQLMDFGQGGDLDVDWRISGGVLFGKQETLIEGSATERYWNQVVVGLARYSPPTRTTVIPIATVDRSEDATVPLLDLSLGLSYEVGRVKVGAGYRWERYFDALDVGYDEAEQGDRTIDGPYFKFALGFGG